MPYNATPPPAISGKTKVSSGFHASCTTMHDLRSNPGVATEPLSLLSPAKRKIGAPSLLEPCRNTTQGRLDTFFTASLQPVSGIKK